MMMEVSGAANAGVRWILYGVAATVGIALAFVTGRSAPASQLFGDSAGGTAYADAVGGGSGYNGGGGTASSAGSSGCAGGCATSGGDGSSGGSGSASGGGGTAGSGTGGTGGTGGGSGE